MKLDHAQRIASEIVGRLRPFCDFLEVGGSIRRMKPDVKDIEIVCTPKVFQGQASLVDGGDRFVRSEGFVRVVNSFKKIKGDARIGKYMQREMPLDYPSIPERSIKIDIFTATSENRGYILLIRTGDKDFSEHFIGTILPKFGFKGEDGFVWDGDTKVWVPDEATMFGLCNWPVIPPHLRTMDYLRSRV